MASAPGAKNIYGSTSVCLPPFTTCDEKDLLDGASPGRALLLLPRSKAEPSEASKERDAAVKAKLQKIQVHNPGRKPDWTAERLEQMDRLALEERKRCIMFDDEGDGFYLLMNWDWQSNRPAKMPQGRAHEPGWFENVRSMLKAPLLDPSVPEERLAAWLDSHTMHVHQFLDKLDRVREDGTGKLVIMPDASSGSQ